ncbi:hypothetical protein GQ42DRAFT_165091 [Ramicandelaber brevisporus]|nr:hypothetical protein GQ42DRAFT_165091 [Ramicandelaber brevisporus]
MTTAGKKEAAAAAYLVPRLQSLLKRCIAKAEEHNQHRSTVSDIDVNCCSHRGVNRVLSLLQFILNHDFADDEPRRIGTTEDFDPEDEYIDMPELFLDDDSADCDFDFMPNVIGSSKSKNTSDQAKESLGYKTVQQYMANLSGIEVYRAMLDIVYTYDLCRKHICILCFAINDIHRHNDEDLQQDNDTAVEQGKQQEAATTNKRKRKARDTVAADDNDDNDDSNGTVATDTPTRMIITRRSLKLQQAGQTVPMTVDVEAATNDENVPPAATTSAQQPNSNKRRKVDSTTTTTKNGTAAISQIQPPVTRARARLQRVSGTSTCANPSSASSS